MGIGEEWFVELTGDGIYDVYVKIHSFNQDYVNLTIQRVYSEIQEEVFENILEDKDLSGEKWFGEDSFLGDIFEKEINVEKVLFFFILVFIFIVIISIYVKKDKKKKRYREFGY